MSDKSNRENRDRESEINRRDFMSKSAVGVGLGIALDASSPSTLLGMSACQADAPIDPTAITELRQRIGSAQVLTPSDSAYATTGLPLNGRYRDIRPGAIALCKNEDDVVACVKWCGKHRICPVGRGGGHSYAGFSTTTGLLIDIGKLNSVEVNKQDGTAVVGGAALNRDVYRETKDGEYFLSGGTCPAVGVGGLVLGGGIGYNSRWAGLTCDSLVSTRIVTASGELLEASESQNKDLYWACRGGAGGSFGINTSFTFKLPKVPTEKVTYFRLQWRGADAAAALFTAYNNLMATGNSKINAIAMAQAVEIGAHGKREAINVVSRGQYIGPKLELMRLLQHFPPPQRDQPTVEEMPFWEAAKFFINDPSESHSFGDISRYANKPISDNAINRQIDLLADCPSRSDTASGSMWSLGWVGGDVVNSIGRTDTAYVHRKMSTLLRPTSAWPDDAASSVGEDLIDWTDRMAKVLDGETPRESYQNFPNRRIEDWHQQYYAENLKRLVSIKKTYDEGNLFNNAQSIPVQID